MNETKALNEECIVFYQNTFKKLTLCEVVERGAQANHLGLNQVSGVYCLVI